MLTTLRQFSAHATVARPSARSVRQQGEPQDFSRFALESLATSLKENLTLLHTILETGSPEIIEYVLRNGKSATH